MLRGLRESLQDSGGGGASQCRGIRYRGDGGRWYRLLGMCEKGREASRLLGARAERRLVKRPRAE